MAQKLRAERTTKSLARIRDFFNKILPKYSE